MQRVLLVEDDANIREGISDYITGTMSDVFTLDTASDGIEGLNAVRNSQYDLLLLDIMLPGLDGFTLMREIRKTSDIPVIFLTARVSLSDRLYGYELGCDDYICKPFRVNELMARIRAVLRRSGNVNDNVQGDFANGNGAQGGNAQNGNFASNIIKIADITIYTNEAKVTRFNSDKNAEESIELTALEYRLLLAFCNNRGIVLSRKNLLEDMWDVSGDFVNGNTLTVYIKRLRDKIEKDPANPLIIKTVRGLGYIMM